MPTYVDGFLIPIPKKNLKAYRAMAAVGGKIWKKHGALEYRECVGDDLAVQGMKSFPRCAGTRAGETVLFSWITYKSRAHRDSVNKKVMKDPRMLKMIEEMKDQKRVPFDMKRMAMGGFKVLVEVMK